MTCTVREKFLRNVVALDEDQGGCWQWIGHRRVEGYGVISIGPASSRRNFRAHRLSWELFRGAIPSGLSVLHKCDNRPCVNPDHLFLGTQADNVHDAAEKRRMRHVLSDDDVRHIRDLAAQGWKQRDIAAVFGVDHSTVGRTVRGEYHRVS